MGEHTLWRYFGDDGRDPACRRAPSLTCIHQQQAGATGLCRRCQDDYDEDPDAWWEFGDHPAGIARWQKERRRQQE